MVSRATLATITAPVRARNYSELMARAYWEAFRAGYASVGGKGYPKWEKSADPIKAETIRCMRHAVEVLVSDYPELAALFPGEPQARTVPRLKTDDDFIVSHNIARMGE